MSASWSPVAVASRSSATGAFGFRSHLAERPTRTFRDGTQLNTLFQASATHHLANVLGAMSLALTGSLSHWPEVVEYAEKLAAALRDENLNEWRNLVSDAKPFLEEATHLASRLGVLKRHLLEHTLGVTQADSAEHVAQIDQYACLLAHTDAVPRDEAG